MLLEQDCMSGSSGGDSDSINSSTTTSNPVPALAALRESGTVVVLLTAGVLDNPKKLVQLAIAHRYA